MLSYDKIVKGDGEALAIPVNPLNLKEVLEPEKAIKHLESALFDTPLPPSFSREAAKLTFKWKTLETLEEKGKAIRKTYGGKYRWIRQVIEASGLRDGRKRLLFYVLVPYWVTIEGRSVEETVLLAEKWVKRQSRRDQVSRSWIRSLARNVRRKNIKPWSLGKIREKDLEIFETICRIIGENV